MLALIEKGYNNLQHNIPESMNAFGRDLKGFVSSGSKPLLSLVVRVIGFASYYFAFKSAFALLPIASITYLYLGHEIFVIGEKISSFSPYHRSSILEKANFLFETTYTLRACKYLKSLLV